MFKVYFDWKFFDNCIFNREILYNEKFRNFFSGKLFTKFYDIETLNDNNFNINNEFFNRIQTNIEPKKDAIIEFSKIKEYEMLKDSYPFKIFFLNINKLDANSLSYKFGFIILTPDDFELKWNQLTFDKDIFISNKTNYLNINSFDKLKRFIFQNQNTGLIYDRYIFKNHHDLIYNVSKFLRNLFIPENKQIIVYGGYYGENIIEEKQNAKLLSEEFNNCITHYVYSKIFKERYCFTNYYFMNINHSLQSMDKYQVKDESDLNISSLLVAESEFKSIISKLLKLINVFLNSLSPEIRKATLNSKNIHPFLEYFRNQNS